MWSAKTLLESCSQIERDFGTIRNSWIAWLEKNNRDITEAQTAHMNGRNKALNLALRLVRPFRDDDKFWSLPYDEQCREFVSECARLRPLIDFLR
jgi:hypothetical protein